MVYTATDKEQIDEIKRWWNDYGKAITIAVVIGLIIGFGWRYWGRYKDAKQNAASTLYQTMMMSSAAKQYGVAGTYVKQLQNQYPNTVYAVMGSFMGAKDAVAEKKYDQAHKWLSWVVNNGKFPTFVQVARIRDARILLQQGNTKEAMLVLSTTSDKAYQPIIDEVTAQIYLAEGKKDKATALLTKAKSAYVKAGIDNPLITFQLNS